MRETKKGNEFKGLVGGKNYVRFAQCFGMNKEFYNHAIGNIMIAENAKVLDVGCGPGALSFALAQKDVKNIEITRIDISEAQLTYARSQAHTYNAALSFVNMSMDELAFPDNHFDVIVSSMALHETPPEVRRAAIKEVSRTLKPGGFFIYTDWSRPRFGLWGIIWFPLVCRGKRNKDNWNNVYLSLCSDARLYRVEDGYINSIARRQVFKKSEE